MFQINCGSKWCFGSCIDKGTRVKFVVWSKLWGTTRVSEVHSICITLHLSSRLKIPSPKLWAQWNLKYCFHQASPLATQTLSLQMYHCWLGCISRTKKNCSLVASGTNAFVKNLVGSYTSQGKWTNDCRLELWDDFTLWRMTYFDYTSNLSVPAHQTFQSFKTGIQIPLHKGSKEKSRKNFQTLFIMWVKIYSAPLHGVSSQKW